MFGDNKEYQTEGDRMMDLIDDYILFDTLNVLSGDFIHCSECCMGVLIELDECKMICDVCDCKYVKKPQE